MDVHIPQAGYQKLAGGINDLCAWRDANLAGFAERRDAIAVDDDRHIRLRRGSGHINDGDVGYSQRL